MPTVVKLCMYIVQTDREAHARRAAAASLQKWRFMNTRASSSFHKYKKKRKSTFFIYIF